MRAPILLTVAVLLIGYSHANAPASVAQTNTSEVDFSGVYAPAPFVDRPALKEPEIYPFTAAGKLAYNAYDPLLDNPRRIDDCAPETMPGILWLGAPMEITQANDLVVLRFERGNTIRAIPIEDTPPAANQAHTELGYSVGRWVGDVLTIETTHMASGSLRNNTGFPLSPDARVIERYWRKRGTQNLQLELTVDDPINYTETFTLGRVWVWAPEEELRQWECVSLGPRNSEPDIDELARMLEEL